MQKLSLIILISGFLIISLIGGFFIFERSEKTNLFIFSYQNILISTNFNEPKEFYLHSSGFFDYKDLVIESFSKSRYTEKINYPHIYGGIVPHHFPNAISLISDFYERLSKNQNPKTFIILGPNHFNRGNYPISVSLQKFETPFGIIKPDLEIINKLISSGLVKNEEKPFSGEHSIGIQTLFIKYKFPSAKIVPIIFRSSVSKKEAIKLGKFLGSLVNNDIVIICSIDLSHNFDLETARARDENTIKIISTFAKKSIDKIDTCSNQAVVTLIETMETGEARETEILDFSNSAIKDGFFGKTTGWLTLLFSKKPLK